MRSRCDREARDLLGGLFESGLGSFVESVPGEAQVEALVEVLCRLEHRQCERTKVTPATTQCFYIIQGNAATPRAMLEAALARLVEQTIRFCGGREERAWIVD